MYREYRAACRDGSLRLGGIFVWGLDPVVYNLATQVLPGPEAELSAIASAVARMVADAADRGVAEIGMPRIGAGIGGLAWSDVERTIQDAVGRSPVELIVYSLAVQEGR